MNNITYDFLWEMVIVPQIQTLDSILQEKYSASEKYHLQICDLEKYKSQLQENYNISKNILKNDFFQCTKKSLVDIHKIAACYCKGLVENKVFSFDIVESLPLDIVLCNYSLAFSISVGVMYENLLAEYKKLGKKKEYDKLKEKGCLMFPKTNPGHDSYALGRVKTLALNDIYGIDFDLLTYAAAMFWVEEYNKNILRMMAEGRE